MEVGSISITGTIDTSDIERGKTRINNSLSEIRSNTESSFGSFERLKSVTSSVAGSLVKIGTVGLTAMSGLASLSPQVAPAMAKIANETRKLSFALGEQLQPLFASIGNDLIPAIGTAIDRFSPQITGLVNAGVTGISDISNALRGEWDKIDNIIPKSAGALIGGAAGFKVGGFYGMLIGASLGHAIGDLTGTELKKTLKQGFGEGGETEFVTDISQGVVDLYRPSVDILEQGSQNFGIGGTVSKYASGMLGLFDQLINFLYENTNDKNMTFAERDI
jgi:hypothetical protein